MGPHAGRQCLAHFCRSRFREPSLFLQVLEKFSLDTVLEHKEDTFGVVEICEETKDIWMPMGALISAQPRFSLPGFIHRTLTAGSAESRSPASLASPPYPS